VVCAPLHDTTLTKQPLVSVAQLMSRNDYSLLELSLALTCACTAYSPNWRLSLRSFLDALYKLSQALFFVIVLIVEKHF